MNEKRKQWREEQAIGMFKDHVATIERHGPIEMLTWKKPDSWTCGVRYYTHGNYLMIVGDLGEAVFQWSQNISMEFVAGCDFSYFMSKCQASEHGSQGEVWSRDQAREWLDHWFKENKDCKRADLDPDPYNLIDNLSEWHNFLHNYSEKMFNYDFDGCGAIGMEPSHRLYLQFRGLQLAMKQLDEARVAATPAIKETQS